MSRCEGDLLGQSLSAVSLKGDPALRMLDNGDRAGAVAVLGDLTSTARSALRDVRVVAHDRPPRSLPAEVEGARRLLDGGTGG